MKVYLIVTLSLIWTGTSLHPLWNWKPLVLIFSFFPWEAEKGAIPKFRSRFWSVTVPKEANYWWRLEEKHVFSNKNYYVKIKTFIAGLWTYLHIVRAGLKVGDCFPSIAFDGSLVICPDFNVTKTLWAKIGVKNAYKMSKFRHPVLWRSYISCTKTLQLQSRYQIGQGIYTCRQAMDTIPN